MLDSQARRFRGFVIGLVALQIFATVPPPPTRRIPVKEVIHGVTITDDYRWLENQNSPETRAWIKEQQKYTASFFASLANRKDIRSSLEKLVRIESRSVPVSLGGTYFFKRRLPTEQQGALFMRRGLNGEDIRLVDPDRFSSDHSVSIDITDISPDGNLLAYQVRKGGQDEVEIHFLNLRSKKDLPEVLPRYKQWTLYRHAFTTDNSVFYYNRQTDAGPRVYLHRFGTPVSADELIFGAEYGSEYFAFCGVTSTGRNLFCMASKGATGVENDFYVRGVSSAGKFRTIARHVPLCTTIALHGDHIFVLTGAQAPNRKVLDIDLDHPARKAWRETVHEGKTAINDISVAANKLFVISMENASARCFAYSLDDKTSSEVILPTRGDISNIDGEESGTEAFFSFSSFAYPESILHLGQSNAPDVWWRPAIPFNADAFQLEQVWYASRDGTKIPMFLVRRKGDQSGTKPALLTGYGGFGVPVTPSWNPVYAWWLEHGGMLAVPSLRGGGEFGEAWHRAGMFENKQNVFDDFIAAAEYLIHSGLTTSQKLAIEGGSNGGLLVGAVLTQRPDLFSAAVCRAPLLDMIRYQRFGKGVWWISEYGTSEDRKQFEYLYRYSPYHHVKNGTRYPAVLFVSGDSDTRVDPLHARKMAALMQSQAAPGKPILLRYDTLVGHSGGMSTERTLDLNTDILSFLKSQTE